MLLENIETISREMSLVDLVFKTFSNWGKSEIPPSQLLPSQLWLCNPFPLPLSTVFDPLLNSRERPIYLLLIRLHISQKIARILIVFWRAYHKCIPLGSS
jgi:hypothetical protein